MNTVQPVTIHDAKTNLSKYISAAKKGRSVFIGAFGKAEVKLVAVTPADLADSQQRDFSIAKGQIEELPESFSAQTEQEITDLLLEE